MASTIPEREASLERQLKGYRLATAEITYRLPDHPSLLQTFIWQHHDLAPGYPERRRFLAFWAAKIEGRLFSVRVGRTELLTPARYAHAAGVWQLH
jgi:uncharacterized protein Usg